MGACNRRRPSFVVPAHGDGEMPGWGPILHEVDFDQDWGEVRLDAITKHLESMPKIKIKDKWRANIHCSLALWGSRVL
jgi:hypothetical protein